MAAPHETYTPPRLFLERFHCPHPSCGVFADQTWATPRVGHRGVFAEMDDWQVSECRSCGNYGVWREQALIYPLQGRGASPNPDMPEAVMKVYEEAREVSSISRKSAAGLLRLALQMLVEDLEPGSGSIDKKIGDLVGKGLPERIQKAMDTLRVIGNEAVHPGEISLDDADDTVIDALFALLNLIVEDRITKPKMIDDMFDLLPDTKVEAIQRRNAMVLEARVTDETAAGTP